MHLMVSDRIRQYQKSHTFLSCSIAVLGRPNLILSDLDKYNSFTKFSTLQQANPEKKIFFWKVLTVFLLENAFFGNLLFVFYI